MSVDSIPIRFGCEMDQLQGGRVAEVGVLDKAMAIVDIVELRAMTVSEIARRLDSNLSTTHRLASSMVTHGLLQRDESGRYSPGWRFDTSKLVLASRPFLERLRDQTTETTQLWLKRGDLRVCLASAETVHELRVTRPPGTVLPLAEGGSAARVLEGEIGTADADGPQWIESISQRTAGISSISAPITNGDQILGAICIVVPLPRVSTTLGDQWGPQLTQTVRRISELLRL